MLAHYKDLFREDFTGQYAIPAFNVHNLEIILGVVRAAVAKRAPVILEAASNTIKYAGLKNIESIVASVASDPTVTVPVALHLDHTKEEDAIKRAIEAGFSSVMIDGSSLPFEENIAITKRVADFAHQHNVWVQGELGRLRGSEDWVSVSDAESFFTDPDEANEFVRRTGVNTLAIAVGTLHGIIKFRENVKPKLDIERIKRIKELVGVPLILHGSSGVDEFQISQAIKAGIVVFNIDTELRIAFTSALKETLINSDEMDPRKVLTPAIDAVQAVAEKKLDQFKTSGKAVKNN